MLVKALNKVVGNEGALKGYRTIISGYAVSTLPAVIEVAASDLEGWSFWIALIRVAAGPAIHYFYNKK